MDYFQTWNFPIDLAADREQMKKWVDGWESEAGVPINR